MTIVCVLRCGGAYDLDYVLHLRRSVRAHSSDLKHNFVCLTDLNGGHPNAVPARMIVEGVSPKSLLSDWPLWWAKMEAFRIPGPALYFDLDTVIVGSIDPLVEAVTRMGVDDFLMLRAFRDGNWASGIMGWAGDFSWLTKLFSSLDPRFNGSNASIPARDGRQMFRGDQEWIRRQLAWRATTIIAAQDVCSGLYSYKHHCRKTLPPDTKIVCFHGRPRPADVQPCPSWLRTYQPKVAEEYTP